MGPPTGDSIIVFGRQYTSAWLEKKSAYCTSRHKPWITSWHSTSHHITIIEGRLLFGKSTFSMTLFSYYQHKMCAPKPEIPSHQIWCKVVNRERVIRLLHALDELGRKPTAHRSYSMLRCAYFLPALAADLVTFPVPPTDFSTDLMTPTATV